MFQRKVVGLPPVKRLGMMRSVVCAAALLNVFLYSVPVFPGIKTLPFPGSGFLSSLSGLSVWIMSSAAFAIIFRLMTAMLLIMAMVGWKTRPVLWLGTIFYAYYLGLTVDVSHISLSGVLALNLLFFLCWLPCDEGFSIERKMAGRSDDNRPSQSTGWAIFLLRTIVAVSLFQAGINKLRFMGVSVFDPWQMKYWLIDQTMPEGPLSLGYFLPLLYFPAIFWKLTAAALLFVEITFPAALFSWHLRRIYPLIAAIVVFAAGFARGDLMPDVLMTFALFYDWDRIFSKPGSRRAIPPFKRPARII